MKAVILAIAAVLCVAQAVDLQHVPNNDNAPAEEAHSFPYSQTVASSLLETEATQFSSSMDSSQLRGVPASGSSSSMSSGSSSLMPPVPPPLSIGALKNAVSGSFISNGFGSQSASSGASSSVSGSSQDASRVAQELESVLSQLAQRERDRARCQAQQAVGSCPSILSQTDVQIVQDVLRVPGPSAAAAMSPCSIPAPDLLSPENNCKNGCPAYAGMSPEEAKARQDEKNKEIMRNWRHQQTECLANSVNIGLRNLETLDEAARAVRAKFTDLAKMRTLIQAHITASQEAMAAVEAEADKDMVKAKATERLITAAAQKKLMESEQESKKQQKAAHDEKVAEHKAKMKLQKELAAAEKKQTQEEETKHKEETDKASKRLEEETLKTKERVLRLKLKEEAEKKKVPKPEPSSNNGSSTNSIPTPKITDPTRAKIVNRVFRTKGFNTPLEGADITDHDARHVWPHMDHEGSAPHADHTIIQIVDELETGDSRQQYSRPSHEDEVEADTDDSESESSGDSSSSSSSGSSSGSSSSSGSGSSSSTHHSSSGSTRHSSSSSSSHHSSSSHSSDSVRPKTKQPEVMMRVPHEKDVHDMPAKK